MGHEICAITATESDTVEAAAQFKPDVMIIDAHLKDGSGITAVETILRKGFIPHVFASGDPAGIFACKPEAIVLEKPFHDREVVIAIQDALAVRLAK